MFLSCLQTKFGSLLSGLPFLAWKRHPFSNDSAARLVFGLHNQSLFSPALCGMHARKTVAQSIAVTPQLPNCTELKSATFLAAGGNLSVLRAPLRTGPAHIVLFGPIGSRVNGDQHTQ